LRIRGADVYTPAIMGAGTGPPGHREASTARMTMKQRGRLHAKTAWDKAAGEA